MSESATTRRKFTGNACLHRDIGLRVPRRFLRRNLRQILDSHERSVTHQQQKVSNTSRKDMIANGIRSAGWNFPTRQMLQDLMKGNQPTLQLSNLQIRHPESNVRLRTPSGGRNRRDEGLDWLPSPSGNLTIPCQVGLALVDGRSSKSPIFVDSQQATIHQTKEQGSSRSHFDIELDRPFFIEVGQLFVVTESGSNGFRHWKRTILPNYAIEVSLQCLDADDSVELLSRLETQDVLTYQKAPWSETVLKTTWDRLPECPSAGDLLDLKRSQNHASLDLPYKIEMSMGWSRRDSALAKYNRASSHIRAESHHLPTPSTSDESEKSSGGVIMVYKFRNGLNAHTKRVDGFSCPFCLHLAPLSSFGRLLLHCTTFHDHFKFETEADVSSGPLPLARYTVLLSLIDQQHDKPSRDPAEQQNWVAPVRPFDLSAHLRGEDDWMGQSRPKNGRGRGRVQKESYKDAIAAPHVERKRPAPEEVVGLSQPRPREHRVPDVHYVNFYHTTSKKSIKKGDWVTESDDDIDEGWLAIRKGHALEEMGVQGPSRRFVESFDRHLADEGTKAGVLIRESLVRFTRIFSDQLQSVQWQKDFRSKLKQLQDSGVIDEVTTKYCIQNIRSHAESKDQGTQEEERGEDTVMDSETESVTNVRPSHNSNGAMQTRSRSKDGRPIRRHVKERIRWTEGGFVSRERPSSSGQSSQSTSENLARRRSQLHGSTHDEKEGPPQINGISKENVPPKGMLRGTCICGKCADNRGCIRCASLQCLRRNFHLQCVGLERRVPGWRCSDCATS